MTRIASLFLALGFLICSAGCIGSKKNERIEVFKENVKKEEVKEAKRVKEYVNFPLAKVCPFKDNDGYVIFNVGYSHEREYWDKHIVVFVSKDDCDVVKSDAQNYTSLRVPLDDNHAYNSGFNILNPYASDSTIDCDHYDKLSIVVPTEEDRLIWQKWLDDRKEKYKQHKRAQEEEFNRRYKNRVLPPKD